MILGNESVVFTFQVVLAVLSIIWISLQRLATPPEFWAETLASTNSTELVKSRILLCSLHNVAGKGEVASFGQLLPLIFLVLPLFTAYGSYIGQYHLLSRHVLVLTNDGRGKRPQEGTRRKA
jgi:hypothetical protein